MNLDEAQKKKVATWIAEGLKLSEIQNRIGSELGIRLTYMDVRLLVDDLKLVPKDMEPAKAASATLGGSDSPTAAGKRPGGQPAAAEAEPASSEPAAGGVSVRVDPITLPGALVSGKVTFSDGKEADWHFDQAGRLALASQQPGYRPPAADLRQFQLALEAELSKLGL
jgi:hypothetical protein